VSQESQTCSFQSLEVFAQNNRWELTESPTFPGSLISPSCHSFPLLKDQSSSWDLSFEYFSLCFCGYPQPFSQNRFKKEYSRIWFSLSTSGYLPQSVYTGWRDEIILTTCVNQGFHILSSTLWKGKILFNISQRSKGKERCREQAADVKWKAWLESFSQLVSSVPSLLIDKSAFDWLFFPVESKADRLWLFCSNRK
jgi:hypothetical protein